MEIYEKRHVVKAVVDAVTYLLPTVLGCMITAIAISPTTFNTTILHPTGYGTRWCQLLRLSFCRWG